MGRHRLHSGWIFPLNGPNLETPSQTCPEICLLSDFRSCQVGTVNLRDAQKPWDPGSHPGHCRDSTGNGCREVWEADMAGGGGSDLEALGLREAVPERLR